MRQSRAGSGIVRGNEGLARPSLPRSLSACGAVPHRGGDGRGDGRAATPGLVFGKVPVDQYTQHGARKLEGVDIVSKNGLKRCYTPVIQSASGGLVGDQPYDLRSLFAYNICYTGRPCPQGGRRAHHAAGAVGLGG